jgi:CRP-like cAMP-binding protein
MTLIEKVFLLKSIHPFDVLLDREIILISNIVRVKHYKAKDIIHNANSLVFNFSIIADGEVAFENGTVIKDYFGLENLTQNIVMESSIIAVNDVTLLLLSQEHLLTLLHESPHLVLGFLNLHKEDDHEIKI